MIKIPSVGHLQYKKFKHNIKQNNIIEQTIETLSYNRNENYHPSSVIHLYRYLAENYKDEFTTAADGSGLTFSCQMLDVETASMMSDVGLSIS